MGHLRALIDTKRAPRMTQPHDQFTKAELWERLQAAERAVEKFQTAATLAHNFAQGETGEARRKLFAVRDAIYGAKS